jgi:hypothetical protein
MAASANTAVHYHQQGDDDDDGKSLRCMRRQDRDGLLQWSTHVQALLPECAAESAEHGRRANLETGITALGGIRANEGRLKMGQMTEATIAAFQKEAGIMPSEHAGLLKQISDAAFELIKVIELERSGIRDGDGYWHGSDVMGGVIEDVCKPCREYLAATAPTYDGPDPVF